MITTLDLSFLDIPNAIAAFLLHTSAGPVLVECGPYSTLPHLREALRQQGVPAEDIRHVLVTHIHFDHAGAAWWFARQGATIYLHPKGAPHLAAPERLWESARMIYGDQMEVLWGAIEPIAPERLRTVEDREVVTIGDTDFMAHHTPGHAVHHIAWQVGDDVLTGDVAGVKIGQGPVVPPCPPPDIMVEDWKSSIARLRALNARRLHLTHYGTITDSSAHLRELETRLTTYAEWMRPYAEKEASVREVLPKFQQYVREDLERNGVDGDAGLKQYEAANPAWMSVSGLLRYWKKHGLADRA